MILFSFIIAIVSIAPAYGWDRHQGLMAQMMDTDTARSRAYLQNSLIIPSEDEQKSTLASMAKELEINADKVPLQKPGKTTVMNFLQGESIDEPDQGMDQDLPDSTDPRGDRAWMGGKTGPTSQGFRHMYFPGIEWGSPLRTLQIPTRAIGQSPERILKLHSISQKFLKEKNHFWGLRTLLWELHLVQDLHQPFHVTQVPYIRMLPWRDLLRGFVARSTQVIANHHYAYEGLVNESVSEGKLSPLATCFEAGKNVSFPRIQEAMVEEVIRFSRAHAYEIGVPLYLLWDRELKDPVMNLPEGIGSLDYYSHLHANPEEQDQKDQVEQVQSLLKTTCELLKNVSQITFSELDFYFQ